MLVTRTRSADITRDARLAPSGALMADLLSILYVYVLYLTRSEHSNG
jgi:hypothetical protein